ncbi:hypothetical protein JAO76_07885 [Pontibacter sp. BT310]|uniref:DUF3667 domain-containing protein n=1 Tax=Pontibacter populi TaxID=890055 RepID=A0ABS6XAD8_9BACT|nr:MULTISPECIES: hypothetical protein [Pontibacter]MBJ6118105.1 hypothetical protein [Pontibacter sp. BT310]MBR0570532.1 hypothetical protein [Microvirga sp. STS03]MBW3364958.1 hypothetical protein [Pontibacter populi]
MRHYFFVWLFILSKAAVATPVDTIYTYYPNGKVKAVKVVQQRNILSEMVYLENGNRKHKWDLQKSVVYSYNSFGDTGDSSAAYFLKKSPYYTIYQYYGDSPNLLHIERYQDNVRHGKAQYFHRNGQLKAEGEFDNWEKVGFWKYGSENGSRDFHWHIINHSYYEQGISVFYTILPFLITLSLIIVVGYRLSKKGLYPLYYRITVILPFALFALWALAIGVLGRSESVVAVFFVILHTTTLAMVLLSLINVIWAKRLHVRRYVSLLLVFVGLFFYFFLIWLKVIGAIAGVMVM